MQRKKRERRALLRREGGRLAFDTPIGALNPFAIYCALVSILLSIPWFIALTTMQLVYALTRNRFDRQRRIPVFLNHLWGATLLTLTRCWPKAENMEILQRFYKEGRPAMFVANHNSWMDIPYLGSTIGWRNYKIIAKKELSKVPALGKAIYLGGHVMVDRTDRKSQLKTLKTGIQYLKDGVHLCTFPEGTRSRTGKVLPFKNGAFKMAYKAGAPIIPLSIVGANKMMPAHWMFPFRSGHGITKVIVHDPIECKGKTEAELAAEVRKVMLSGLPLDQRSDNE
jgi:1-acyl-sn-glycerol-3-phosphate acyltransferase